MPGHKAKSYLPESSSHLHDRMESTQHAPVGQLARDREDNDLVALLRRQNIRLEASKSELEANQVSAG